VLRRERLGRVAEEGVRIVAEKRPMSVASEVLVLMWLSATRRSAVVPGPGRRHGRCKRRRPRHPVDALEIITIPATPARIAPDPAPYAGRSKPQQLDSQLSDVLSERRP